MREKCKACEKREGCDGIDKRDLTLEEINEIFNKLTACEDMVGNIIMHTLNEISLAPQWAFFNALANKFRALANELNELLPDDAFEREFDWDNMMSVYEMSEGYLKEHEDEDREDWFTGDIKEL